MSSVGIGPHPRPWPDDDRLDPELLEHGDTRNVVDQYRYWKVEAIKADLDQRRYPLEIAIENHQHDFNIGTIVRNANAFNLSAVHIIGKRQWNRRGAMVTDLYMHVYYHPTVDEFVTVMQQRDKSIIGVDIIPGAIDLADVRRDTGAVLVFGAEGPGLSDEMKSHCRTIVQIPQSGSTRSINVGVASGIVLYEWTKD